MTTQTEPRSWLEEFTASYRDLLRFLRRRTRCDELARDLAHDVWLRITDRNSDAAAAITPATSDHARAYLFTVADRLAIDHLRRQRLWHEELAPRLMTDDAHIPDVAESHAYGRALHAVDAALAQMPPRMRDVFVAHRLEGVPHEELALRFQVSRKTIEREVTRAMDLAQRALTQDTAEVCANATPTPQRQGRRKTLGALLGLAGLSATATLAWQLWREQVAQWQTAFSTRIGNIGRLPLPDGSELTLNADSAVEVRILATRREVKLLRGGAFFDVAHDAARPFVVLAGEARVSVLGTRFAVEMETRGVAVDVESGRVSVQGTRRADPVLLGPGDRATVDANGVAQRSAARSDSSSIQVAPWRSGWLDFNRTPLGEAVAQLNRYRPQAPIRIDPALAGLPVLARVNIARSHQWLQGLPAVLPVRVNTAADGSVVIQPR